MKKYNKFFVALGLGVFTLTSCHMEDAPAQDMKVDDPANSITSSLTMETMANGLRTSFRSLFYGDASQVDEVMCDGFNATADFGNNYGSVHRTDVSFTAADYDTEAMWENNYAAIKNYNIFIEALENFTKDTTLSANTLAEANYFKGEAHFYRAYSYLQLVRHFGKDYDPATATTDLAVPLVLKFNLSEKPARATVKEVYDQIKADLDIAEECLADEAGEIGAKSPTIDAVDALFARYYLDVEKYDSAAIRAQNVINSPAGYDLSSTYADMVAEYDNDKGTEPIMQLAATLSENGSGTNDVYMKIGVSTANYSYFKRFCETGFYVDPYFLPSQKLIDQYDSTDLRLAKWFDASKYIVWIGSGINVGAYYVFAKYEGNPELTSNTYKNSRQHVKPFLISEMYLIDAEANLKLNNTTEAKASLNAIQAKRGAALTEANDSTLQAEWFKETVGEGLRFTCLKRWHTGFSGRAAQPGALEDGIIIGDADGKNYAAKVFAADDFHWQWPVPSYEIRVNNNLVQNQGY